MATASTGRRRRGVSYFSRHHTTAASATFHAVGANIATAVDATGSGVRVGECGAAMTTF